MIRVVVSGLILAVIVAGCTTTDAFTVTTDDYASLTANYSLIAVSSDLADNRMAQALEYAVIDEMQEYGISGHSWMDIFPPLREYTVDEQWDTVTMMGIDMIVYASLEDNNAVTNIYSIDGNVYSGTEGHAMFTFTFFPTAMNEPILVTQINAYGDEFSDWETINAAVAKRAVEEYVAAARIDPSPVSGRP